jgi:hypothetical protein
MAGVDTGAMAIELTTDQARVIARLRRRWPRAAVRAHQRAWGVIVEVRDSGRTVALVGLDGAGGVHRDRRIRPGRRYAAESSPALPAVTAEGALPEAA